MGKIVSVVIPAYNEENYLGACLEAVLAQSVSSSLYEVVVVDNASTDRTARLARRRGVRVVHEAHKGYVHALRRGIASSTGELFAFTDADCLVPPDWIARLVADFAAAPPQVVAVGGRLAFYDLDPLLERVTRFILARAGTLPGGNMAIRREALERMGGIDPRINLSLDYWITLRLKQVGRISIDPGLVVLTSARRFHGAFGSQLKYPVNVLALQLLGRPLFFDFPDVRGGQSGIHRP
jgi:glycosyltransferase involved in cell wall biosynthesis